MSDGTRRVTGIGQVISEFTIRGPQNIKPGEVDQAIARAAGGQPAVSLENKQKLLAPRATNKTPPAGQLPANASSCEARKSMDHATPGGVQLTTGMYLQCLNDGAQETLKAKANTRMQQIRQTQASCINTADIFASETNSQGIPGKIPMDRKFAEACAASAARGSVFIMRGVNKDSLGENGVLLHPECRAPKPMTCHAKSSEFGFTKGLVPANPQFSRPAYVDKNGDKYKGAFKDVNRTLGRTEGCKDPITAGVGSTEGKALHLKVKINSQDCHVYQGTFQKNGITYRYQVAIPADTPADAIQQTVQARLQDANYCKVSKDSNWGEGIDLRTLSPPLNTFTSEPTLVIGLPAGTEGTQHAAQDRYYVSDYDVYAVAHTSAAAIGQNEQITSWGNHGEFADPRDIKAIIAVNAQLLGGQGQPIQNLEGQLGSRFRDFPIQHAPCAATQVTGGDRGSPLAGYAVPDFMENPPKSLWVVEQGIPPSEGSVIELKTAEDFAAYMITKSTEDPQNPCEAIFNSKVLDYCMAKLSTSPPAAAA
jgi:hypothetical protein